MFSALFHVANAIALLAFVFRDQVHLRMVIVVSMILQGAYYYLLPGGPLYDPLVWKVLTVGLNIAMIAVLFRDRIGYGIDSRTRPLYERLRVLNYGQFRRLLDVAGRIEGPREELIRQDTKPDGLYYLLEGEAEISKDGGRLSVGSGIFLGEIAFLTQGVASANVALKPGAYCIAWDVVALRALMAREGAIDIAIRGLLNHDLASKTARSALPPPPRPVEPPAVAAETVAV